MGRYFQRRYDQQPCFQHRFFQRLYNVYNHGRCFNVSIAYFTNSNVTLLVTNAAIANVVDFQRLYFQPLWVGEEDSEGRGVESADRRRAAVHHAGPSPSPGSLPVDERK